VTETQKESGTLKRRKNQAGKRKGVTNLIDMAVSAAVSMGATDRGPFKGWRLPCAHEPPAEAEARQKRFLTRMAGT